MPSELDSLNGSLLTQVATANDGRRDPCLLVKDQTHRANAAEKKGIQKG